MKYYWLFLVASLIVGILVWCCIPESVQRVQMSDNENNAPPPTNLPSTLNLSSGSVTYSGTLGSGDNLTLTRQPNPGYEEYSTITTGQQNTCIGYACKPYSPPTPSIK